MYCPIIPNPIKTLPPKKVVMINREYHPCPVVKTPLKYKANPATAAEVAAIETITPHKNSIFNGTVENEVIAVITCRTLSLGVYRVGTDLFFSTGT